MEELKGASKPKWSDELTKFCNTLSKLSQSAREIENHLDGLTDQAEHLAATRMVRYELMFITDILQRCPWRGDS
jgi:hypothetical protein